MLRCSIADLQARLAPIVGQSYALPKTANKGAFGLWLEEKTGIPHSTACLDCTDGELKTFPLKRLANGRLTAKETVAVTMLNGDALKAECFADSRCAKKMSKMLMVPYLREGETVTVYEPKVIAATDPSFEGVYTTFRNDYEAIRTNYTATGELKSGMGTFLQNRTKGAGGHAPKTRAFYLRTEFLKQYCL
jgi:hypothetical protein